MEYPDTTGPAELICVHCGHANSERASRCAKCKSPLDGFAFSSPWEMGTVRSSAYSPVRDPRTKPIIFWGVWLYFGPSAVGSLWGVGTTVYDFFVGKTLSAPGSTELTVGAVLSVLAFLVYGALSIWAVWSVTKGYFCKTGNHQ